MVMILLEVIIMKQKNSNRAQNFNAYYIIVIVGILALASLIIVDNIQGKKERELVNQRIELSKQETINQNSVEESDGSLPNNVVELDVPDETAEVSNITPATEGSTEAASTAQSQVVAYDGKTKLEWPVVGNVILPYSMNTTVYFQTLDQYKVNPAMLVQATEGADVSNIYEGKVESVKKDPKIGTTVVVDLGNKFKVIYAQLNPESIKVKKGDVIDKGFVIGKVIAPTDFFIKEGAHLYFAMTKDNKPVNPMDYLK